MSLEARLRAALRELEATRHRASEDRAARERALAILAHELRGPLMPILVMAHVLESDPTLSARQQAAAASIRRNVEVEDRLIADLFDLTRIATGRMELVLADPDVGRELREVLNGCAREIADKELNVAIELQAEDHRVRADPIRLYQILWNLLHNAVKFTPAQGTVSVRSVNARPGWLVVEVTDTGIGIESELLPRIFDPFEQGGTESNRRFGGLGLGLAICRGLVDAHGGSLSARSEGPGKGATFTLELPLAAG